MGTKKRLSDEVRGVLERATVDGLTLRLPAGQLERKLYTAVNDAVEAMGGKWNRKLGSHAFATDPAPLLAALLGDGVVPEKNPDAFFPTPPELARRVALLALPTREGPDVRVLEPSAGLGAIARELRVRAPGATLHTIELNPARAAALRADGFEIHEGDFLGFRGDAYDVIAMNPPFAVAGDATAWITHVRHALTLLRPSGRLVAIVPRGVEFRTDRKHRELLEAMPGVMVESLDDGAFKESGTGVNTSLLVYDVPLPRAA